MCGVHGYLEVICLSLVGFSMKLCAVNCVFDGADFLAELVFVIAVAAVPCPRITLHLLLGILSLASGCLCNPCRDKQTGELRIATIYFLVSLCRFFLSLLWYRALPHTHTQLSSIYGFLQVPITVDWSVPCAQNPAGMLL